MPHVRDVRATPHEDHDLMLVAALAAGDLAGTDRDQAIALVDSCPACATLRDDLQSIARATRTLPPPVRMPARDFRLSEWDAARLRPAGWRRFLPGRVGQAAFTRPLGVALATFGLIGLLVTNVPIGLPVGGSAASAPYAAGGGGGAAVTTDSNAAASAAPDAMAEGSAAAAPGYYPAASAAPSIAPAASSAGGNVGGTGAELSGSAAPRAPGTAAGSPKVSVVGASAPAATSPLPGHGPERQDLSTTSDNGVWIVRNIVFVAAIGIGLTLLILARRSRRAV